MGNNIEHSPKCLEVCNTASELRIYLTYSHLQWTWECSILALLVPSVDLMHRQIDEN